MEKYFEQTIAALIECVKHPGNDKMLEEAQFCLQLAKDKLTDEESVKKVSELLGQIIALRNE